MSPPYLPQKRLQGCVRTLLGVRGLRTRSVQQRPRTGVLRGGSK